MLKELLDPSTFNYTSKMTITATKIYEKAWLGAELELFSFAKLVRQISTDKNPLKSSNFTPIQAFSLIFVAVTVILQVFSNLEGSTSSFNTIWRVKLAFQEQTSIFITVLMLWN